MIFAYGLIRFSHGGEHDHSMTTRTCMASVESMAARMIAGMTSHGVGMVGRMITSV